MASAEQQIPFVVRLKAWWEGYDPTELMRHAASSAPGATATALGESSRPESSKETPEPFVALSPSHIEFLEGTWGPGYMEPGGDDYIINLCKPLGLDPAHTVLDLGVGLGGSTRAIAKTFGVWMEGVETDNDLVELAMQRSTEAGLADRAPVRLYVPHAPDFPGSRYNAIFAREAFYRATHKNALIESVVKAIKGGGQFLFTDFLLPEPAATTPELEAWKAGHEDPPELWTVEHLVDELTTFGLEVRVQDDDTDRYKRLVLGEWARFVHDAKDKKLPVRLQNYVVHEAELHQRRFAALESGVLRLYRVHAYKKGVKLMSD